MHRLLDRLLTAATALITMAAVAALASKHRGGYRSKLKRTAASGRVIANPGRVAAEGARLGSSSATTTIVIFSDYLCRYCAQTHTELVQLLHKYPRKLAVVFRHYPIQTDLSFSSAVAAECARRAGKFESFTEELFDNSDSIGLTPWTRFAQRAEVSDTIDFLECMKGPDAAAIVNRDIQVARELDVHATPTLLVGEVLFKGSPGLPYMERYIQNANALKDRTRWR